MKYIPLKIWASHKMRNEEQYEGFKNYNEKYNDNPKLIVNEFKEFMEYIEKSEDPYFNHIYYPLIGDVSSVLIRDYYDNLSEEEKSHCKETIYETASVSLKINYNYQLWDGVESAISVLPLLLKEFPEEKRI